MNRGVIFCYLFGIVCLLVVGCSKYDDITILGKWECNVKEQRGLTNTDSCTSIIVFDSGTDQKFTENYYRKDSSFRPDIWVKTGNIERKRDKITFLNIKKGDEGQPDVTYEYELIEGETLTLIVPENEGYKDNKKIYKKIN